MQSFLPVPDFHATAHLLDRKRLGKQRLEAKQIFKALSIPGYGWNLHPAVLMWKGHRGALCLYGIEICNAWRSYGYRDQQLQWFVDAALSVNDPREFEMPPWLSSQDFHRAHRSNLIRKDPDYYSRLWEDPDNLEYVWPVMGS